MTILIKIDILIYHNQAYVLKLKLTLLAIIFIYNCQNYCFSRYFC